MVESKRSPSPIWSILFLLALVGMIPINFVIGSVLVMGADPCLGFSGPGGPLKCTLPGEFMITGVPTSTAVAAVVLAGAGAMHTGSARNALFLAAGFLPFLGLVISYLIAAQPLP